MNHFKYTELHCTFYFRCYERGTNQNQAGTETTMASVTGTIIFVLVALVLISGGLAFYNFRENRKLRQEKCDLERELHTNNLISTEKTKIVRERQQINSETHIMSELLNNVPPT